MPLSKCLNAPWINGRCDGVPVVGHMFSREPCRNCEKHEPTKAEATLEANMAAVDGTFKRPIITAIVNLSAGEPLKGLSLGETLETINQNLALLVKGQQLTVKQSAAVLTVAMEAYKRAEKSRITELFGSTAERPIDHDVVTVMLNVVDAIEAKHMKGITIDVGQGVKAKVSKMAKESIKVERSETSKKIYEE